MDDHKTLVLKFLEIMQSGELDHFDEIIHNEYSPSIKEMTQTTKNIVDEIAVPVLGKGIAPLKERFRRFLKIWQNNSIDIIDLVEEGDTIIVYYNLEFDFTGSLLGMDPHGKRVKAKAYHNFKIKENKIIHAHMLMDYFDIIQQIEADGLITNPMDFIHDYLERIKTEGLTDRES